MVTALLTVLRDSLRAVGFDLVQPFAVGWYNDAVGPEFALPDFGDPRSLGAIIGNTRALWPHFLAGRDRASANPLDDYSARTIGAAIAALDVTHEVRYAHEPPPRRVAMQRLADISGLAPLSASHLNVHAEYGPWIGLRAAVVWPLATILPRPAVKRPCDCAHGCGPAFARAMASIASRDAAAAIREDWRIWVAVRDACPVGRAHRYGEPQLRYHYAPDPALLER